MINISRRRYIVIRNIGNGDEVFSGLARNYQFTSVDNLGNIAIKTYMTANKAKASVLGSWYGATEEAFENGTYRVVPVDENIIEVAE